jgi:hypothetical protein
MVQETKAAIQTELLKADPIATPLSSIIISYWILGTIYQNNWFVINALSLANFNDRHFY